MTPCASLRVRLAVEPHTDQSASLTVRTHQARLGGSTRSSSCASNPNVAHASLRGKQMPAKMTYSGVALNERGPSFRNPTPTIRKNSCNEPPRKEANSTVRRASAPLGASADQDDTIRVQTRCGPSINPSHVDSGSHTRLFVMGGHGELKLLARAMRACRIRNCSIPTFREWFTSLGRFHWARGGARSSFAAEIVL